MTEPVKPTEPVIPTTSAEIIALRAEFTKQFTDWKTETAKIIAAKDSEIAELKKSNQTLNSDIVKNALVPAPKAEPTAQEAYDAMIKKYGEKTVAIMKGKTYQFQGMVVKR